MTERQLLNLKNDIEVSKTKISKSKGKLELFMQQLQDDWDCEAVEQAEKKKEKLLKDKNNLQQQINNKIEQLETIYLQNDETEEI